MLAVPPSSRMTRRPIAAFPSVLPPLTASEIAK